VRLAGCFHSTFSCAHSSIEILTKLCQVDKTYVPALLGESTSSRLCITLMSCPACSLVERFHAEERAAEGQEPAEVSHCGFVIARVVQSWAVFCAESLPSCLPTLITPPSLSAAGSCLQTSTLRCVPRLLLLFCSNWHDAQTNKMEMASELCKKTIANNKSSAKVSLLPLAVAQLSAYLVCVRRPGNTLVSF
jgi:hypothetical protein